MNARVTHQPPTLEQVQDKHDALILSIAADYRKLADKIQAAAALHYGDQPDSFAALIDQLDDQRSRLYAARDSAYEMQRELAENEWNRVNEGVGR